MDDPAPSPFSIDPRTWIRRRADPADIAQLASELPALPFVEVAAGGRHDRFPIRPDSQHILAVLSDPSVVRRLAAAVTTVMPYSGHVDSGRRNSDVCLTFTEDVAIGGPWLQVAGHWATHSQFHGGWPIDATAVADTLATVGISERYLPRDPDPTRRPFPPPLATASALTERWLASLPGSRPVNHELRHALPGRWVRLHSFAAPQRYIADQADLRQVVHRHRAVLTDLSGGRDVLLVTGSGSDSLEPVDRVSFLDALTPEARYWQSFVVDDEHGAHCAHLWVQILPLGDPRLEMILWMGAEDAAEVLIADPELHWLFAPYDGGVDVIAADPAHRDRLAQRFREWLPVPGPW